MNYLKLTLALIFLFILPLPVATTGIIFVVIATLLTTFEESLVLTLISGLLMDFLSGLPDGVFMITTLSVFLIIYFFVNKIMTREVNLTTLYGSVITAEIIFFLIFAIIITIFAYFKNQEFSMPHYTKILKDLIYALVLTYPIFVYYKFVSNLQLRKNVTI